MMKAPAAVAAHMGPMMGPMMGAPAAAAAPRTGFPMMKAAAAAAAHMGAPAGSNENNDEEGMSRQGTGRGAAAATPGRVLRSAPPSSTCSQLKYPYDPRINIQLQTKPGIDPNYPDGITVIFNMATDRIQTPKGTVYGDPIKFPTEQSKYATCSIALSGGGKTRPRRTVKQQRRRQKKRIVKTHKQRLIKRGKTAKRR
jgi:hypothetical protein